MDSQLCQMVQRRLQEGRESLYYLFIFDKELALLGEHCTWPADAGTLVGLMALCRMKVTNEDLKKF